VQAATRADGAEEARVRAWQVSRGAAAVVAEAEVAVVRGDVGAAQALGRAREALQDVTDQ
jgi:hypothetical protein